jgi:hypothetical protein
MTFSRQLKSLDRKDTQRTAAKNATKTLAPNEQTDLPAQPNSVFSETSAMTQN